MYLLSGGVVVAVAVLWFVGLGGGGGGSVLVCACGVGCKGVSVFGGMKIFMWCGVMRCGGVDGGTQSGKGCEGSQ